MDAYLAMWADEVAVSASGDYQSPRLAAHASGRALSLLARGVYSNHLLGLTTRGTPTFAPRVTATNSPTQPTRVTVADCVDDTHWLVYYAKTGKLHDDIPGGKHRAQALLLLDATGAWKVDQLVVQAVGTC